MNEWLPHRSMVFVYLGTKASSTTFLSGSEDQEKQLSLALVFLALTTLKSFRFLLIKGSYYLHFPEQNPITDFFCDP